MYNTLRLGFTEEFHNPKILANFQNFESIHELTKYETFLFNFYESMTSDLFRFYKDNNLNLIEDLIKVY